MRGLLRSRALWLPVPTLVKIKRRGTTSSHFLRVGLEIRRCLTLHALLFHPQIGLVLLELCLQQLALVGLLLRCQQLVRCSGRHGMLVVQRHSLREALMLLVPSLSICAVFYNCRRVHNHRLLLL